MRRSLILMSLTFVLFCQASIPEDVESWNSNNSYTQFNFDFVIRPNTSNALCNKQLNLFQQSYDNHEFWARKLRDSWGKLPAGIFSGNVFDFGHFDQCIGFQYESIEAGIILGRHCTIQIPVEREQSTMSKITAPSRSPRLNVAIGICFPSSCSPSDVKSIIDQALKDRNSSVATNYDQNDFCTTKSSSFEFTAFQIFAIVFFSSFSLLLIISTIYEVRCNFVQVKPNPFLSSFSVYTNSKVIMTFKPLLPNEMVFLHGLRSIAIIWIVYGHTYSLTFYSVPLINPDSMIDGLKSMFSTILYSGYLGVDTFFLLSSLLLTLSIFRELDKTGKINLKLLYLKRYFRLTVPLAAALVFTLGFLSHIADGPMWNFLTDKAAISLCKDNWWSTLLYVGNLATPGRLCFGHSWFLMVDTQLYFISPIFLYPIWRLRTRAKIVIPLIFAIASIGIIYIFAMFMAMKFRVSNLSEQSGLKDAMVHTMTLSRLSPWMMGVLVAYIMHSFERKVVEVPKLFVLVGWTMCFFVILLTVFVQYPLIQENYLENHLAFDATYESLKAMTWCLAIGWIILACKLTNGGVVKRFLSLSIWLPISKLSFCIYLVHVPVQFIYLSAMRAPIYFSSSIALFKFFGDFGVSFFIAFAWALLFEYPTLTIISILLAKRKSSLLRKSEIDCEEK